MNGVKGFPKSKSATATNQTTLQGAQGTGASYNPPTGGSGVFGWLSGIYKEIVSGIKLKLDGADIGASNPVPIAYSTATITPRSGTITLGGTAQSFMTANAARKGWFIQNNSTGDLWVNRFGGTASAAQPSILVRPGRMYETPPGGSGGNALSIFGATTGQAFTAGEW